MSSAIPYEPEDEIDDVLDNNPFQEPFGTKGDSDQSKEPGNEPGNEEGNEEENAVDKNKEEKRREMLNDLLPERKNKFQLVTKITGLERVGSSSNKRDNPTIIFNVTTNLPTFRKKAHKNVRKSNEEFKHLFKYLNAAVAESFIPSLPPTYTHFGINTREDYKKVISNYQEWFDRISRDALILANEELAYFIECDFDTYYPVNSFRTPVSGLKRRTMKQFAPPYDEHTELAEFRPLVKSVHALCDNIQEKLLKVSRARKLLVEDENLYGQCFTAIHAEQPLYRRYGQVMTAVGDVDSIIASLDMATLYDGLTWIVRDTYVVKEALTNRHFLMRELLAAQQQTKQKQEQVRKTRTRRDGSPLKVEEATRALRLAHEGESQLARKLSRVTENMLLERAQWLRWYDSWLRGCVRGYVLRRIEYERKKLALLERVRSEVRRADPRGGLSRLGRTNLRPVDTDADADAEADAATTRTTREHSQSLAGDSWTGAPRARTSDDLKRFLSTEFDETLTEERAEKKGSLDARNAASLLGATTF